MKRTTKLLSTKDKQKGVARPAAKPVSAMFYNFKGGSTKTTTCCHLACMLALRGKKVVLIDAAMQCNLTGALAVNCSQQIWIRLAKQLIN